MSMDASVKVSIIVPVYNVDRYLIRCLDSIVNQTYKNIEIILVNDGSTDESLKICRQYEYLDKRIILIDQNNMGLSGARNTGISRATGDYLCFVDSDDWLELDYIKFALDIVQRADVPLVVFGYYNSTDFTDLITYKGWLNKDFIVLSKEEALYELIKDMKINSHAWDKLYRRDLFNECRFPIGRNFEDIFIMHRVFDCCDKIALSVQPKYHYYVRPESIARDIKCKNVIDYLDAQLERSKFVEEFYPQYINLQNTKLMEAYLTYFPKFRKRNASSDIEYNDLRKKIKNIRYIIQSSYNKGHEQFTQLKYKFMYKLYALNDRLFFLMSPIARNMLEKIKVSKCKSVIKRIAYKDENFKEYAKNYSNCKRAVLIGLPEYDNLGDIAIGYAEIKFIQSLGLKESQIFCITESNFWKYFKTVKKSISKKDLILIQGGGNFGNQYPDQEKLRKKIIKNFSNQIILMPSTFYLLDEEKTIKHYVKLYNRKNITLIARERCSYEKLKKYFSCRVSLSPDIVLSLPALKRENEREGIALCLRNDVESKLSVHDKDVIKQELYKIDGKIYTFDTCINMSRVSFNNYENELHNALKDISKYKLVVTDKLHAMIFCALTSTPCVAIGNYNHKVKGVVDWLKNNSYVHYMDNISKVSQIVKSIDLDSEFEFYSLIEEFHALKELIIEELK